MSHHHHFSVVLHDDNRHVSPSTNKHWTVNLAFACAMSRPQRYEPKIFAKWNAFILPLYSLYVYVFWHITFLVGKYTILHCRCLCLLLNNVFFVFEVWMNTFHIHIPYAHCASSRHVTTNKKLKNFKIQIPMTYNVTQLISIVLFIFWARELRERL